jgi:hypothetical protein
MIFHVLRIILSKSSPYSSNIYETFSPKLGSQRSESKVCPRIGQSLLAKNNQTNLILQTAVLKCAGNADVDYVDPCSPCPHHPPQTV